MTLEEHTKYMTAIKEQVDIAKSALQHIADISCGVDGGVGIMALYRRDNLDMILACADMHRPTSETPEVADTAAIFINEEGGNNG